MGQCILFYTNFLKSIIIVKMWFLNCVKMKKNFHFQMSIKIVDPQLASPQQLRFGDVFRFRGEDSGTRRGRDRGRLER